MIINEKKVYNKTFDAFRYRNCDDMLARRLAGNYPSYAHKTSDTSYKQFITPTGNPHKYVKVHKRYCFTVFESCFFKLLVKQLCSV